MTQLHPATVLAGFFFFAAALPALSSLALCVALLFALLLAGLLALGPFFSLLRRCRFLILALCILYACFTPGEALWGGFLSALAPSREGVVLAAQHMARLLALLAMLAFLLKKLALPDLLAGTMSLLQPLRIIGLVPARAALRLALVLDLLQRQGSVRGWREWVGLAEGGGGRVTTPITIPVPVWKMLDLVFILLFALACAGAWSLAR